MESLTDSGIILRRTRHLDDDARLTVFLREHGKMSVISKSSIQLKSKLKSLQEPFSEADLQIYLPPHGVRGRLTGGKLINSHEPLRRSYEAYVIASSCCEVVDTLVPFRAPSPEVFDILRDTLAALEAPGAGREQWIRFVEKLLKSMGHGDITPQTTEGSLERRFAVVNGELEKILPWRLKSDVSSFTSISTV